MKTLKSLSLVTIVALVAALKVCAGDTSTANPYFGTLSTVSPAELPAKAAELVAKADAKSQAATTADVVKAAVGLNPAAAAAIVGTIAQSTPEMASVAAATAAALVPEQAVAIAHAAAAAAPSQAGKIVEAVCRIVPTAYQAVANTVAQVAPGQGKAILAGVAAAIPALQEPINKAVAAYNGATPSAPDVLGKISPSVASADLPVSTPLAITPAVHFGPPYVPPPSSPVNYSAGSGGQEQGGGHVAPP